VFKTRKKKRRKPEAIAYRGKDKKNEGKRERPLLVGAKKSGLKGKGNQDQNSKK